MKCIVETTGSFMLLNGKEEISSRRPSVATFTPFIDTRLHKKELRTLATDLPDTAEDEVLAEIYAEMIKNIEPHKDPEDPEHRKYLKKMKATSEAAVKAFTATLGKDTAGKKIKVEKGSEGDKAQKKEAEEATEAEAEEDRREAEETKEKANKEAEEAAEQKAKDDLEKLRKANEGAKPPPSPAPGTPNKVSAR